MVNGLTPQGDPVDEDKEPQKMTIQLNVILDMYKGYVQLFNRLVAAGLQLSEGAKPDMQVWAPATMFQVGHIGKKVNEFSNFKEDFDIWIVRAGFIDLVETTKFFLNQVRKACRFFSCGEKPFSSTEEIETEKEFLKKPLPTQIKFLKKEYGIDTELSSSIKKMNSARRCLVHRMGVLNEEDDLDKEDKLALTYVGMRIYANEEGVERQLTLEDSTFMGSAQLQWRLDKQVKEFTKGEQIILNSEEFGDICATFSEFGRLMIIEVEKFAKSKGIKFVDKTTPIKPV